MSYTPTTWVEGVTKVGPTNLNHLEGGLQTAAATADAALPTPAGSNGQFLKRVGGVWLPTTFAASDIPGFPSDASKSLLGDGTWGTLTLIPAGVVSPYAAAAAPSGWALCDGSSVLRAGSFAALFAVIGTTYGSVDGTHFTLPDLRGRVTVGYAVSGGHADVSTLGANDGVAAANRRSKHRHTAHAHTYSEDYYSSGGFTSGGIVTTTFNTTTGVTGTNPTSSADGGSGNANDSVDTPSYLVLNYIIKT